MALQPATTRATPASTTRATNTRSDRSPRERSEGGKRPTLQVGTEAMGAPGGEQGRWWERRNRWAVARRAVEPRTFIAERLDCERPRQITEGAPRARHPLHRSQREERHATTTT